MSNQIVINPLTGLPDYVRKIATSAETVTGTEAGKAVTPAGLTAKIDTDTTLAGNLDTRIPSQKAVKTYVDNAFGSVDAFLYMGVIDCSANPNYPAGNAGETYKVSVAGKIGGAAGANVQAGDMAICAVDGSVSGDQATVGANWNIIQGNMEFASDAETVTGTEAAKAVTPASLQAKVASDSAKGIVELATSAETSTGTDTGRAVTPASLMLTYAKKSIALDVRDFVHDDGSGTNKVISTMAYIPKFLTAGWPQAALNGLSVGGFWIDVYKNAQPTATSISVGSSAAGTVASVSRPGVVPWHTISWINARIAASNRIINGRACHLITPFERFAVLSWVMQSGNWGNVRGNNDTGKDTRDAATWQNYGILDITQAGRTLTGSGPASWWSGGVIGQGIHGLVANIYEWEDCRIESGFIQPLAYLAGARTAADAYIDYDDNAGGDGVNITHLTPGIYTITDAVNGNEDVTVTRVLPTGRFTGRAILSAGLASNHGDNCAIQLKTAVNLCDGVVAGWVTMGKLLEDATGKYMALPDVADVSTHAATLLDSWYKYDNSDSRALIRCGYWANTTRARSGLLVYTGDVPTGTGNSFGFRAVLSLGNL